LPVPKVIDFGIAKATGPRLSDATTAMTGLAQVLGTPLYMSPEQADASGHDVDTRSDVYSLGVLLYELLTGTTPFEPDSLHKASFDEIRRLLREQDPPAPSTRLSTLTDADRSNVSANRQTDPRRLARAIHGELDWIVMKCLEKDRARRYETVSGLADDLMRYLTDRPVEAGPPSVLYRFSKFARRNRVALTTAGLVALALLAGTAVSTWQAFEARRARQQAMAQSRIARQAVDEMYTEVASDWLNDQPQLTPLQRRFLEKALGFYQKFTAEWVDNWEAKESAAQAAFRVGGINRVLGRYADAEVGYRQAMSNFTVLADAFSVEAKYRSQIGSCRWSLGMMALQRGDLNEAEREHRAALEIAQAVVQQAPSQAEYRKNLAIRHSTLADVMRVSGRPREAEVQIRQALKIQEELARKDSSDQEIRSDLAQSESDLGSLLRDDPKRIQDAEACCRRSIALCMALVKEAPRSRAYPAQLGVAHTLLGILLNRMKRLQDAEQSSRQAIGLLESLTQKFPDFPIYREELADAYNILALTLKDLDRSGDGEVALRKIIDIREQLVCDHPDVPGYRYALAGALHNESIELHCRGDLVRALQRLERAVVLQKTALKLSPKNLDYRNVLCNHYLRQTLILVDLGDYRAAAAVAGTLAAGDFPEPEPGRNTLMAVRHLTHCVLLAENDTSLTPEQRNVLVRSYIDRIEAIVPEAARRGRDRAPTLYILADLLTASPVASRRNPQLSLNLARRAVELQPDLQIARQSLGWAQYRAGDWRSCLESLEKPGKDGDFVQAMARWQLGDLAQARADFGRADAWLEGYERRFEERRRKQDVMTYPEPWQLRQFRSEAAALMGLTLDTMPNGRHAFAR
jgi:tetratricopeptide (TPR) repeat protein